MRCQDNGTWSTFDLASYISKTSGSATEHVQRQLQAKEAQIKSRTELYEEQTTRLLKWIDASCDKLEQLQNSLTRRMTKNSGWNSSYRGCTADCARRNSSSIASSANWRNERITLQAELDAYRDGQELVALAEEWL